MVKLTVGEVPDGDTSARPENRRENGRDKNNESVCVHNKHEKREIARVS